MRRAAGPRPPSRLSGGARMVAMLVLAALPALACNERHPVLDTATAPSEVGGPIPSPRPASTIFQLQVAPRALSGAGSAQGTVLLTLPAPAEGLSIALSSSDAAVTVPAAVAAAPGRASAGFPVTVAQVQNDREVTLTATVGERTATTRVGLWALLPTFFSFDSEPGEYVGAGQARRFTPDTATFSGVCSESEVRISINTGSEFWFVWFGAPRGQPLRVGTYSGATRTSFRQGAAPGIDVSGAGRGCNTTSGSFTVHEADYTASGEVRRFWATFEQLCGNNTAALRGDVRVTNLPPPTSFATCHVP